MKEKPEGMIKRILNIFTKKENDIHENAGFKRINEIKDIKIKLLSAMSMTHSRLNIEDVQSIFTEEQYEEVISTIKNKWERIFEETGVPYSTEADKENRLKNIIDSSGFEIVVDDKNNFLLKEFPAVLHNNELKKEINPDQIDVTKLANVVERAMQEQLDFGIFYDEANFKKEEIPQFLKYYINVAREYQVRETEAHEDIKIDSEEEKKKENINVSKDIKNDLLSAISKTQTWLTMEDLQTILPVEEYQEIVTTLKSNYARYAEEDDITQEKIEKAIKGKLFVIEIDESGFILHALLGTRIKLNNPDQLDATKLASVVEKAMQKHLDYKKFYANRYLEAEEFPQFLKYYINVAKEYQERERSGEKLNETESSREVSDERKEEENRIIDLSSEKAQLVSEIADIENQLEELKLKEAEIKKTLKGKKSKLKGLDEK